MEGEAPAETSCCAGSSRIVQTFALKQFGKRSFSASHIINFEENPLFGDVFKRSLEAVPACCRNWFLCRHGRQMLNFLES